ncbi:hypothetical protein EJ03DRAFT_78081 [Teratosphaeria nubilosa]|uniref:Uncharacterized protein n=1 Tax=Teratosphaeria nubilosa TaxID=161662 RepID=A0A6G1LBQ1_9PEZI|nr:hypothetical protein EJ03DRAFT_78081 [Teratosphaeria nubilosa]
MGTILLNEGAQGSADEIRQMLKDGLHSSETIVPTEQTPDGASDRWIRKGIHILQDRKVVDSFDVGEFMTFAHAYVAGRVNREGPSMIAYPKVHQGSKEMSQKHGLWLSYPTREAMREVRRSDDDEEGDTSRKYGGLM